MHAACMYVCFRLTLEHLDESGNGNPAGWDRKCPWLLVTKYMIVQYVT